MKYSKLLYKICKIIYTFLLKLLYRPKVIGKENIPKEGSLIFAGNHKNAIDPILVMSNTNRIVHYMAKEELFKGLHGLLFKKIGLIKVYRDRLKNTISVSNAEKILKNSGTIGIFPEGTRNRTDKELLEFKSGAIKLAQSSNTKIIPFAIKGEYRLFRKGLRIEFGKLIDVGNMELVEANKYLKSEVLNLLRK